MTRLIETRDGTLRPLLAGRDMVAWHTALVQEIAAQLSPTHAAVLAQPVRTASDTASGTTSGTAWETAGARATRYSDLPTEQRRALERALGAILSDIRRLAESGTAPTVREAWPALAEVPDMGHVYAVDGRPVLTAWGHEGVAGRLLAFDDGVAWRPVPRRRLGLYGVVFASLAALGLGAGLLWPVATQFLVPVPSACRVAPGQLAAMGAQLREEGRGEELRTLLASLTDEIGRRQLQCPIRTVPAPPAPQPPAPPPAPPPRAALPQDQWDQHDLTMLNGCWRLITSLHITDERTGRVTGVRSQRMCFNADGHGTQTTLLEDGRSCTGPLRATFNGAILRVADPEPCTGPGLRVSRSDRVCRRTSDDEAECHGRNLEGALEGGTFDGRFRR